MIFAFYSTSLVGGVLGCHMIKLCKDKEFPKFQSVLLSFCVLFCSQTIHSRNLFRYELPHLVWNPWDGYVTGAPDSLDFVAYIRHQIGDTLTRTSHNSTLSESNWRLQCANFRQGWSAGDTLDIKFLLQEKKVALYRAILSWSPTDKATFVPVSEPSPSTYTPAGIADPGIRAENGQIQLFWRGVTQDSAGNPITNVQYRITRAPFPDFPEHLTQTITQIQDTTFVDTGAADSFLFFYRIVAEHEEKLSPASVVLGKLTQHFPVSDSPEIFHFMLPFRQTKWANIGDLTAEFPSGTTFSLWDNAGQHFVSVSAHPETEIQDKTIRLCLPRDTTLTWTGLWERSQFTLLYSGNQTHFIPVRLPHTGNGPKNSADLLTDIGNCNSLAMWDAPNQAYVQAVASVPQTHFDVGAGDVFFVHNTADVTWPETANLAKTAQISQDNGSSLFVPHLVQFFFDDLTPDLPASCEIQVVSSRTPDPVIVEPETSCLIFEDFALFQCATLDSGWMAGDSVFIRFKQSGQTILQFGCQLSWAPLDTASRIVASRISETERPLRSTLVGNYPNPFNMNTCIRFTLAQGEKATLRIFDINGRLVRSLTTQQEESGNHQLAWNGTDARGLSLPSGQYLMRFDTETIHQSRKLLLLK